MPARVVTRREQDDPTDRYERLILFTRSAVQQARAEGAALVSLPPDNFYSDGTFPRMASWARAGKKAVVLPGIRLTRETAGPALEARWPPEQTGGSYPPRELARLAMDHLHPLTQSLFMDSGNFYNPWPSHIYWRVPGEGFLCRACHLHPLMIDPGQGEALGESTIDGAFLEELCSDPADVHVVEDSDEMMAFELTPREQFPPKPPAFANPDAIARFVDHHATALHREFLKHPIRIHFGDCTPAWEAVAARAERDLTRVRSLMRAGLYHPAHLSAQVDGLLEQWRGSGARVVLYGAGEHTARLFQWTRLAQAGLVGLADGNADLHGQERFGFRVLPPEAVLDLRPDLVLISSFYHVQSIYEDIRFMEARGVELRGFYGPLVTSRELEQERFQP